MYKNYKFENDKLTFRGIERLNLDRTLACGQSFRWNKTHEGSWLGVVNNQVVLADMAEENGMFSLSISPCSEKDALFWAEYFDLDRDYDAIEKQLLNDTRLSSCVPCATGIRVLNQDAFEALITFIISANNNIKRIAGIIERLCILTGTKLEYNEKTHYAFPTPKQIASLTEEQLKQIGTGYRAPYILKSAQIVADGYDLSALKHMPINSARKAISAFPGVGPKVADCVLLFGLGHSDAFPVDVWIARAIQTLFFDGETPQKHQTEQLLHELGPMSGIIQQYIFHYARQVKIGADTPKGINTKT